MLIIGFVLEQREDKIDSMGVQLRRLLRAKSQEQEHGTALEQLKHEDGFRLIRRRVRDEWSTAMVPGGGSPLTKTDQASSDSKFVEDLGVRPGAQA